MWRSKDGGTTWKRIAAIDLAIGVGFGKAAKRNGYPAIYTSATVDGQDGFFRSIDGGTTWQRINDDAHQWAHAGAVITGDPEIYGRVYSPRPWHHLRRHRLTGGSRPARRGAAIADVTPRKESRSPERTARASATG